MNSLIAPNRADLSNDSSVCQYSLIKLDVLLLLLTVLELRELSLASQAFIFFTCHCV